ncbi:MAG: T9SS type A sorting domain-containing protein [Bacteroidota bacterium]
MFQKVLAFGVTFLYLSQLSLFSQTKGCPDPLAVNYNVGATENDGSCTYIQTSISPTKTVVLDDALKETSGLLLWQGSLLSHNDSDDNKLYVLDSLSGDVLTTFPINGMDPTDWESLAQDDFYFYFGDFGNNASGNRQDLKIYRIARNAISSANPVINTIEFSYEDQSDFSGSGVNNTDFDCEALFVKGDSIYLVTKQWFSQKTSIYALPKAPGTYEAKLKGTLDVNGMVTGVSYQADKNYLVLLGYSNVLQPFVYLLYDFEGNNFLSGNKRKIILSLSFAQAEGITKGSGLNFFITQESFVNAPSIDIPPQLFTFNLDPYLGLFVNGQITTSNDPLLEQEPDFYPNPFSSEFHFEVPVIKPGTPLRILDLNGRKVIQQNILQRTQILDLSILPEGPYILNWGSYTKLILKK